MTLVAFDWIEPHVIATAEPSSTPFTHTGDTNWTAITGATTGSITLQAGTQYRISVGAEIKTSNGSTEARIRAYDVTGAAALCGAHTTQTADGEWRAVFTVVAPGAGAREYRLECKIDNLAQTVTINNACLIVEHL